MRVLLDECVPRQLRRELTGFEVHTVQDMGWAGVKNGALLELAATQFDVLLTVDRDLELAHAKARAKPALIEDVLYHLYVLQEVEQGRADIAAERTIPHAQVADELRRKWLLGAAR